MRVPVLKGKLVTLRPLSLSDAPAFCRWLADPEVTRFLVHRDDPPTLREEREYLREQLRKPDIVQWSITTVDGEHIGTVSLRDIHPHDHRAVFGIFIGEPRYWGQGLGTESGRLAVKYGFRTLRLHRISLYCVAYNIRGIRSYRNIGFRQEGRLRDALYSDDVYHDNIVMGILKHEFYHLNRNVKLYGQRKKR